ncbi:TRAP transporter small permease subunit [Roseiflexus sp.]|uniref:TRAP transporter small permease subunit n=1 Tax=Roseiflexus sp. TaxID=2562120 RepID=UPI0021DC6131|nr:TRAP transporter small permease subunit [Roseiflexus sp.]GIV99372.1 MAG: C4-dicarboxylate ABC transporter substrate-binding protein [Roseiflexus sp.]
MQALLRISDVIDALNEWIGSKTAYIVMAMVAIGFVNVIARYIGRFIGTRLTSNAIIELQWYLFSLMFFLGFAYILKHNLNVRVDFWYANWPPRRRALIDFAGTLLFLIPFCILAIVVTINPVLFSWGRLPNGSWGTWEVSPDPDGLPRAPIKSMIIVAFVLLLLQAIAQAIKYLAVVTNTVRAEQAAQIEEYHAPVVE